MVKVSIIMPVFNAVNYIDQAVNSIISQSFKDFELIIIDDGATDGTGEKCCRYAESVSNIYYMRQENSGMCAARNKGISMARGEYIAFADHDDEYFIDYLQELVTLADKHDLDVVKCGVAYEETYTDGRYYLKEEVFKKGLLTQKEFLRDYNDLPISYFGVWNTLYRKKLLIQYGIYFPESTRHGQEDYFFNTEIIPYVKRIGFTDRILYRHFRRPSQSTSSNYYDDRIDAMALYHQRECQILKPLMSVEIWPLEYAVMYARKLTGILSYCFNTDIALPEQRCREALTKFTMVCPYEGENNFIFLGKLIRRSVKYGIVLMLAMVRQYPVMICFWKKKNKPTGNVRGKEYG